MAAKMSFNYYKHGNYGTLPQNGQTNMEVTPDLHLKMSKKIAQLTKVIYALNTKNDEHDQIVQSLKDVHEEEMQQLMAETKEKLSLYKSKINSDTDQRRRIETLEMSIAEHERQRRDMATEFANHKRKAEEREMQLTVEHSQKILNLSKELLQVKKDFEAKLKHFEDMQTRYDKDKQAVIEDMRKAHAKEIDELLRAQHMQHSDLSGEKAKLEQRYRDEITQLQGKYEQLMTDKNQLCEDYEAKLSKAQAFYEKELAVLRENELKNKTQEWQERENALKRQFAEKEQIYTGKLKNSQISELSEEDLAALKQRLDLAESSLESRESDSLDLNKQLAYAKQEASVAMTRLKQVEGELIASKERGSQQAAELLKKSSLLGTLEATRMSNEATIKDLQSELSKVRDRLSWLENERKSLQDKSQSLAQQKGDQLKALEQALEDLSAEKEALRERYEQQLDTAKEMAKDDRARLLKEHEINITDLIKRHKGELENAKKSGKEQLDLIKQELQKKLNEERDKLLRENEKVHTEFDKMKSELSVKLETAEKEIARLGKLVSESEQGLGSASSHIDSLKDLNSKLQSELDTTKSKLRSSESDANSLKTDVERLKRERDNQMEVYRNEMKMKLDQLSRDLDNKWADTLRQECHKLRMELTDQHSEDKKAALQQLKHLKDQEMDAARQGWQVKVEELLQQISTLKKNLSNKIQETSEEAVRLKEAMEMEIARLKQEMNDAAEEYGKKVAAIEASHIEEKKSLDMERRKDLQSLEARMEETHQEELNAHNLANKIAVETARDEAEKRRVADIDDLKAQHQQQSEKLKAEQNKRHMSEMDQLTRAHKTQMAAVKMELERAIELKSRQEKEHRDKVADLQDDLRHRERHIDNVEADIKELKENIDKLNKELEFKGQEILRIQSETNAKLRKQEAELGKKKQKEMDKLAAEHLRETQNMLGEFNRAQDLLKDKISALQIMLEEAEDRYARRESRPEDLQTIEQLREAMAEREALMKQLVDEKRYYQMELVNRETNFNKVFNANPNVGVLNPLAFGKKKKTSAGSMGSSGSSGHLGEKMAQRYVSAPSLNTLNASKLEPLRDSPIHDRQLNPNRPLHDPHMINPRPPPKKFLQ
ncbi:LOW QUALITY PROTEIN: protein FAM184A-like [Ptychodera flava]|uniref:LOW QUALITY PROTEIN: protein FAM184A-like n=1 Tax=Ptychodera flava TaxID=63121 RepID=UPI00396A2521